MGCSSWSWRKNHLEHCLFSSWFASPIFTVFLLIQAKIPFWLPDWQANAKEQSTLGIPKLISDILDLVMNGEVLCDFTCENSTWMLDDIHVCTQNVNCQLNPWWCLSLSLSCHHPLWECEIIDYSFTIRTGCQKLWWMCCRHRCQHSKKIWNPCSMCQSTWFRVSAVYIFSRATVRQTPKFQPLIWASQISAQPQESSAWSRREIRQLRWMGVWAGVPEMV